MVAVVESVDRMYITWFYMSSTQFPPNAHPHNDIIINQGATSKLAGRKSVHLTDVGRRYSQLAHRPNEPYPSIIVWLQCASVRFTQDGEMLPIKRTVIYKRIMSGAVCAS